MNEYLGCEVEVVLDDEDSVGRPVDEVRRMGGREYVLRADQGAGANSVGYRALPTIPTDSKLSAKKAS